MHTVLTLLDFARSFYHRPLLISLLLSLCICSPLALSQSLTDIVGLPTNADFTPFPGLGQ